MHHHRTGLVDEAVVFGQDLDLLVPLDVLTDGTGQLSDETSLLKEHGNKRQTEQHGRAEGSHEWHQSISFISRIL